MGFETRLPDFPWDSLTSYAARAREHPDGIVDLSVGTPVDPTPRVAQEALRAAADAPGYPLTTGPAELREAIVDWYARRRGVTGLTPEAVLPTIGSKELVAVLPSLLGFQSGDVVVHPRVAYPTYDIGARLAGATPLPSDEVADWAGNPSVKLIWLNSPGNPHGKVADLHQLRAVVTAAREIGAVVANDECYAELAWTAQWADGVPSILDPRVTEGDLSGLLSVYSLSKQSNLAGYRAAFIAGDGGLVAGLLELRKHMGMMVPAPVQAAMCAVLRDDAGVAEQRQRYARRRDELAAAFRAAGYLIDDSDAGLYLWLRPKRSQGCWDTVGELAELGILTAPGAFYGDEIHVRAALTATDERITAASERLRRA
jgi:succinyldiaminopimelate transaminase